MFAIRGQRNGSEKERRVEDGVLAALWRR